MKGEIAETLERERDGRETREREREGLERDEVKGKSGDGGNFIEIKGK